MAVLLLIALLTGNSVCSGNNGETISLLLESCKGPHNGSTAKSSKSSDRVSKSQGLRLRQDQAAPMRGMHSWRQISGSWGQLLCH